MLAVRKRRSVIRRGIGAGLGLLVTGCLLLASAPAQASRTEWTMFEDHPTLVGSGPAIRQQTLDTIRALGADTLRIEVKWAEVAPRAGAKKKPKFDATNPSAYPGFGPYDD